MGQGEIPVEKTDRQPDRQTNRHRGKQLVSLSLSVSITLLKTE